LGSNRIRIQRKKDKRLEIKLRRNSMAPDNQLTEETINGIYTGKERLRSNEGTRLLIQDDNFANSPHTTGVSVFDSNTQLAEQVDNDLEPGMRVSLRISVKPGPNGKYRNLLEILNRVSNPTPQVAQAETQAATPNPDTWVGSIDERIAWNSAVNNAVASIPHDLWFDGNNVRWVIGGPVDDLAHELYALIRRGPTPPVEEPEEPIVEGDNIEDNPF
jgi:hypothetical protein